jgi:hypothetical protein
MVRLVEVAARRALADLQIDLRSVPPGEHGGYVETMTWLKHTIEALRTPDGTPVGAHVDPDLQAERRLVAWIVVREQAVNDERGLLDADDSAAASGYVQEDQQG